MTAATPEVVEPLAPAAARWLSEPAISTANRILESHRLAFGIPLIAPLAADATPEQWAQALFASDRVVMAHDGSDPAGDPGPRLIYANRAALRLWRRPWDELVGMPSSLTAEPTARQERAQRCAASARRHSSTVTATTKSGSSSIMPKADHSMPPVRGS